MTCKWRASVKLPFAHGTPFILRFGGAFALRYLRESVFCSDGTRRGRPRAGVGSWGTGDHVLLLKEASAAQPQLRLLLLRGGCDNLRTQASGLLQRHCMIFKMSINPYFPLQRILMFLKALPTWQCDQRGLRAAFGLTAIRSQTTLFGRQTDDPHLNRFFWSIWKF